MNKPNFLCIGAQKAGTTWLSKMLERHPDVWIPSVKELHYFDYVHLKEMRMPERRLKTLKAAIDRKCDGKDIPIKNLQYLSKLALTESYDDEYYLSLFDEADRRLIGEVTPEYAMLPEEGVQHIMNLLGSIKLIFIMRNPVQRSWSFARMFVRERLERGEEISIKTWMNIVDKPGNKKRTDYKSTIENYEKVFSSENLLYLFYDEICQEPLNTLSKVCSFLQIDYDEDLFMSVVGERHNVNPKVEIPDEIAAVLREKFSAQEEFIRNRFNPVQFEL